MKEMKQYTIAEICSRLSSGKGIHASKVTPTGPYPVIGGNGVRGYTDSFNFDGECAIIGRQGANCGNVRYFQGKAYMTEHAIVAIGNENANTKYLACLFSLMHLGNLSAQSAQPGLSVQTLSKQIIYLPEISTQNQIAEIIKSLDTKIEINKQINDNLEQQAKALYKSWFVDFEPFKDEEFVDSELGMIPKGWSIGRIEDLTSRMASGGTPKSMNPEFYSGNICWFTTKELVDGFLIDSEKHISQSAIDNSAAKVFPKGSVLMAIYAAPTVGRLGILSCNAAFNQAAVALIPKTGIESGYIYLTLYNERNNFNNLSSGAAQQNLNVGLVKNYPTCIPSQEVLNNFNTKISPIFMNIERNQIEIFNLTRLRAKAKCSLTF